MSNDAAHCFTVSTYFDKISGLARGLSPHTAAEVILVLECIESC